MRHAHIANVSLAALAAIALAGPSRAAETVWVTNPDIPSLFSSGMIGPSAKTPINNKEVADDFNVIGTIEQVIADGDDCPGCFSGQPVTGIFVRFYAWTANGPGALQAEHFLAANDPNFGWTPGYGPELLEITLPEPFEATGWHYVSVQVTYSADNSSTGKWFFHPVNWGATMGSGAYRRDNNAGGAWTVVGTNPHDASFMLVGTTDGLPPMEVLTATSDPITPSARLRITGDGFGAEQGDGAVLVDDVPAMVTSWSNTVIVAYVPEQTAIGQAALTVVNDGQSTDGMQIDVQPRPSEEHVRWRFAADSHLLLHRPGVGPDGSVYLNDYDGHLYKLTAEGGLVWIVDTLRGQIGEGGEGPVVVGDDGTIYVAANPLGPTVDLLAYNPDGSIAWSYTNPDALGAAAGPNIGPDGNIYLVYNDYHPSTGAISFTPQGSVRWTNPGDPFPNVHGPIGSELSFSSSTLGGPTDQVVLAVDHDSQPVMYAFAMDDGAQNWSILCDFTSNNLMQQQMEVAAGPDGTIYLTEAGNAGSSPSVLQSFDPADGDRSWYFDADITSVMSAPAVDSNGVIYFGWDHARITAVSPDGDDLWTYQGGSGGVHTMPGISPNDEIVLFGGGPNGQSGFIKALAADSGEQLFQVDLSVPTGTIFADDRPRFTPDSATAYFPTNMTGTPGNERSFLYALDLGDTTPPPVTGDATGDGVVNVDDLLAVIVGWGKCGAGACDADLAPSAGGDGQVNVDDLVMVILNWD